MVEILEIPWFADKKRILKTIRTKAKGCGYPVHWLLREPIKSNEKVYLRPKDVDKKRPVRASVRRVLYHLEYKTLPMKKIVMVCDEPERCINPAHMRIRGWEEEANEFVESQIEKGWIRPEEAEEWFGWENKHNVKLPEKYTDHIEEWV